MGCTLGGHSVVVSNGDTDNLSKSPTAVLSYCKFAAHNKTDPNDYETEKKTEIQEDTGHNTSLSEDHSTVVNCADEDKEVTSTTDASFIGRTSSEVDSDHFDEHEDVTMINRRGSNSLFPAIVASSHGGAMTLSRTCRSTGGGYVTLPAIVNRGHADSHSSPKLKDIATRIQSPHVKTIRMHFERQYSDSTSNKSVHFPPFHPSKLRKSFSCNDSWLSELQDDDDWEEDDSGHLPAIKEVEVVNDDALTDTMPNRMKFPYQTPPLRSCWLMSPPSSSAPSLSASKRLRDRSPSMDASRLPVILEDTDVGTTVINEKYVEDTSSEMINPQVGRLDVNDSDVNTTEYSVRMYVASMTELLGLDNIDPRDVPLLNNITIDPSSPLLVQYTLPPSPQNSLEETPTINENTIMEMQKQQQDSLEKSSNNNNNNDLKHLVTVNSHKQQDTVIKSILAKNQNDYINVSSEDDNG